MQQNANIKPCRWFNIRESKHLLCATQVRSEKENFCGCARKHAAPWRKCASYTPRYGLQMTSSRQKESGGRFFSAVVCPCCNSFLPRPRRLRVLPAAFRLPHAAVVVAGRVQIGAQRERQLPCDSMLKKVFSLMSECVCGKGGGRCWAPLSLPPPPP